MVLIPVEPVGTMDRETFHTTYRSEKPVVIQGLARAWPAFDRWDPEQLKRMVGELVVQPFVAFDNVHFLENQDVVERREMPLSQVVEHVFEGRDVLLKAAPGAPSAVGSGAEELKASAPRAGCAAAACTAGLVGGAWTVAVGDGHVRNGVLAACLAAAGGALAAAHCCAGGDAEASATASRIYLRGAIFSDLKDDITVPTFMEGGPAKLSDDLSGIWIGSKGCITPLHFDAWHGVLCQIRGTKRVTLFSPEDTDNMYPRKQVDGMNMHTSELVLEKLDLPDSPSSFADPAYMELFPRAKHIVPWVVDLAPGDALYIPPFWWCARFFIPHAHSKPSTRDT
jgi:hypothetical protein